MCELRFTGFLVDLLLLRVVSLLYLIVMVITYAGDGHMRLQSGEIALAIDPVSTRAKVTMTLRTRCDADEPMVDDEIFCPGDYERSGVAVSGLATYSKGSVVHTSYLIIWDDIRLFFISPSSEFDMSRLSDIGHVDVVFVPADFGGDVSVLAKFVRSLSPAAVVPVYKKLTKELAEARGATVQKSDKFVFKKKDLISGKAEFIELSAS